MAKHDIQLAPSILSADFARLGQQVTEAEQAGADRIHIDVMDGHFVPNLSMGVPIVAALRPVTPLPLETHLMISDPDFFLEDFARGRFRLPDRSLGRQQQPAPHRADGQGARQTGRRGHQSRDSSVGAGRYPPRPGSGPGHDRQSRFRTPTIHSHNTAKDSTRA